MDFDEIIALSTDDAQKLFDAYVAQRDEFLHTLSEIAFELGIDLPRRAHGYNRNHLRPLGELFLAVLNNPAISQRLRKAPSWLADLFDPIDLNVGRTDAQIWLGIACSYAFVSILLNTVPNTRLGIGHSEAKRYINENQPVVLGRWFGSDVEDISGLAEGRRAIRYYCKGEFAGDYFVQAYNTCTEGRPYWRAPQINEDNKSAHDDDEYSSTST